MTTRTNPLEFITPDRPSGYPLTTGELVILAERWWDFVIDMERWWVLSGQVGGSELRDVAYAEARLALLAATLGRDHIDRLGEEAAARWRGNYGEFLWEAAKANRALYQVEAEIRSTAEGRLASEPMLTDQTD